VNTWRRLHPLSPVVAAGRLVAALLVVLTVTSPARYVDGGGGGLRADGFRIYDIAAVAAVAVTATVRWLVTRWKIDGATLRIETGLVRRDSRQLPVARIQAVDLVRPFLARVLGLAELRIRLAGSNSADGRLAYLSEQAAIELRARLLAAHHGLHPDTPEPGERVVTAVPNGRLIGSVIVSGATGVVVIALAAVLVTTILPVTASRVTTAGHGGAQVTLVTGSTLLVYLIGAAAAAWRRLSSQYGFTVAESGDGIRIRRGLLGTVAETIPVRRVQAVRMIEPLLWRPFGWCRVEVDVAGHPGRDEGSHADRVKKALLPVGPPDLARRLVHTAAGYLAPQPSRPPRRARLKAPLSYHFLAAGHDEVAAIAVTGRIRRITVWLPLEKTQSVRLVQGPLQRRLRLATVHLDAAGRRVRAEFRDRSADEAWSLAGELAALSAAARARAAAEAGPRAPAPADQQQGSQVPGPAS
jgi:putative membrane protein